MDITPLITPNILLSFACLIKKEKKNSPGPYCQNTLGTGTSIHENAGGGKYSSKSKEGFSCSFLFKKK